LIDLQYQTMIYSKSISCNCDFPEFWWGLGEEFSTLSKRAFEVKLLFNMLIWVRQGSSQWWP